MLLVDAVQGIQAQTVANFYLAFEQGLDLVPIINKIDLPGAAPEAVAEQIQQSFDLDKDKALMISAKTGAGLEGVLPAVIECISPPAGSPEGPLKLLLFDAHHDQYRGVVCLVEVIEGSVKEGDQVVAMASGDKYEVMEVGILAPEPHVTHSLLTGQVGYLITGMKDVKAARVGDTWHHVKHPVQPLPGFKPAKSMVYAGLYPLSADEFEGLSRAVERLTLNDASVEVKKESSEALGMGFRCGFLGMLHMEVFMQRLQDEFNADVITTTPMVPYQLVLGKDRIVTINSAATYPTQERVNAILEPTVNATIVLPPEYSGRVMELCTSRRGTQLEHTFLGNSRVLLKYTLPLSELAGDFYSKLKSITNGFASFDYEEGEYREADLQRLDMLVNGQVVDALARMVHKNQIVQLGRALCSKMKQLLDRQQFEVVIQAAANGRVLVRETIPAMRKNVLAKCYGGDITRKKKLIEKQKEGKKQLRKFGSVEVPQHVFPELMRT